MENPCHHLQRVELPWLFKPLAPFSSIQVLVKPSTARNFKGRPRRLLVPLMFFSRAGWKSRGSNGKGGYLGQYFGNWEFLTDIPFAGLNKGLTRTPPPRVNRPGFGMVPKKERTYHIIIHEDEIIVLSPFNLYRFSLDSGEWQVIPLGEWLFDAVQISIAAGPEHSIYAGFNRGELPGD